MTEQDSQDALDFAMSEEQRVVYLRDKKKSLDRQINALQDQYLQCSKELGSLLDNMTVKQFDELERKHGIF